MIFLRTIKYSIYKGINRVHSFQSHGFKAMRCVQQFYALDLGDERGPFLGILASQALLSLGREAEIAENG